MSLSDLDFVVFMTQMTSLAATDLRGHRGHISAYRSEILAAIDYLFFGV